MPISDDALKAMQATVSSQPWSVVAELADEIQVLRSLIRKLPVTLDERRMNGTHAVVVDGGMDLDNREAERMRWLQGNGQ